MNCIVLLKHLISFKHSKHYTQWKIIYSRIITTLQQPKLFRSNAMSLTSLVTMNRFYSQSVHNLATASSTTLNDKLIFEIFDWNAAGVLDCSFVRPRLCAVLSKPQVTSSPPHVHSQVWSKIQRVGCDFRSNTHSTLTFLPYGSTLRFLINQYPHDCFGIPYRFSMSAVIFPRSLSQEILYWSATRVFKISFRFS